MAPFGYELEFCGANLVELSCVMQIPLKPKGKYKNYDTFHLEPEEKITTADLNGGELISPIYKDKSLTLQELNDFPNNKEFAGKRKCIRFTKETFELRYFSSSLDFEKARLPIKFATSLASYIGKTKWTSKEIDEWYRNTYIEPRRYSDKRNEILINTLHL
ncbi:TPA: hypothetical protein IAB29_00995 [Candidatus Ventrenecus stercoripullorum]|nr:hypothetical protein [Candidatus Ventrenecus stercoripullorum]